MTTILINTQLTIVTYLIVGFFLSKTGLIDGQAQLFISNLTINVLLPASVFTSFLTGMSMDLLISLGTILILAILLEVFLSLASKIPSSRFTPSEACVAHYGYLVSNGGLIGTPVIESLFGRRHVLQCLYDSDTDYGFQCRREYFQSFTETISESDSAIHTDQ